MGLYMYLTKKIYLGPNTSNNPKRPRLNVIDNEGHAWTIDMNNTEEIIQRVGYWKNANQIHNWFVRNVNFELGSEHDIYIPVDKLQKLLNAVKAVSKNISRANELLPVDSDSQISTICPLTGIEKISSHVIYGQSYSAHLKYTEQILTQILEEPEILEGYAHIYYYAST